MNTISNMPIVIVSQEMINFATQHVADCQIRRTQTSPVDTLTGHLGELCFAQYYYGDWQHNYIGKNAGQEDFKDIEVKCSYFQMSLRLHLLVRHEYTTVRKPRATVQVILDRIDHAQDIPAGTRAYICGYATSPEVDAAPVKDWGSKMGSQGGYLCHGIELGQLHPISELRPWLEAMPGS